MFGFLFRGATYYILWKKFKKRIIFVALSLVALFMISLAYDDLYEVFKVSNKDALMGLFLSKWFLISFIVGLNIYKLRQIKFEEEEKKQLFARADELQIVYPEKSQKLLHKQEKLTTTTDLILKKYTKGE